MKKRRPGPSLGAWGEWKWLSSLLPGLTRGLSRRVVLGPGDDAALVRAGSEIWAVTTDMLVEGVHFDRRWTSGEDLGHKALAVNLSDLAAMGDVEPAFGVLSLGAPPDTPVSFLKAFYRGFDRLARRTRFDVVGGDTVRSKALVVSVTAVGRVRPGNRVFRRDAARPGDLLCVTGTLGDAAAGLAFLQGGKTPGTADEKFLAARLRRPDPRLEWARRLARAGVKAGMDCSDGLWRSVRLMADASGVGAVVREDRVPLSPSLRRWGGRRALPWALAGGEEYELVFTAPPAVARRVVALKFCTVVGEILPARRGVHILSHDHKQREAPSGFEHFDAH